MSNKNVNYKTHEVGKEKFVVVESYGRIHFPGGISLSTSLVTKDDAAEIMRNMRTNLKRVRVKK